MTQPVDDSNHVIISVNPNAGAGNAAGVVEETKLAVEAVGFDVDVISDIDETTTVAEQSCRQGSLRTVIAAGGDGTLALLANVLSSEVPLTILPLGTENLLAKYYGIKSSPTQVAEIVAKGEVISVDSGIANGRRFLLLASCGFDADVVARVHKIRKGHSTRFKWLKPIWNSIRSYKYPELRIFVDENKEPLTARWSFVFNFPCYAMGISIAPMADPDDGLFDLCTFRRGNLLTGLTYFMGILFRQHRHWKDTHFETFKKLRIESDANVPYQLDGDPGGELPLEISVNRKSLRLLLPPQTTKEF